MTVNYRAALRAYGVCPPREQRLIKTMLDAYADGATTQKAERLCSLDSAICAIVGGWLYDAKVLDHFPGGYIVRTDFKLMAR